MLGLAGRVTVDDGWPVEFESPKDRLVAVIHVSGRCLSNVRPRVHHCDLSDLFAAFGFAFVLLAVEAHLRDGGAYQLLWGLALLLPSSHIHWYCYRIYW